MNGKYDIFFLISKYGAIERERKWRNDEKIIFNNNFIDFFFFSHSLTHSHSHTHSVTHSY